MLLFCLMGSSTYAQSLDSIFSSLINYYSRDTLGYSSKANIHKVELPSSQLPTISLSKQILNPGNGILTMQYTKQSFIDTPLTGNSISSQQFMYQQNFSVFNFLPVTTTLWGRATNSPYYRDIIDVQIRYNKNEFLAKNKEKLLREYIIQIEKEYYEQSAEKLTDLKNKYARFSSLLSKTEMHQLKIQLKELIAVKEKSFDLELPDSVNQVKYDSAKNKASRLLELLNYHEKNINQFESRIDSLNEALMLAKTKINSIKQQAENLNLFDLLKEIATNDRKMLKKKRRYNGIDFLSGVQEINFGRAPINTSELTAKNVSLNGVQFTYNSWYIFQFAAGSIDYRFRDFSFTSKESKWSPYWSSKLGIGKLNRNYIAVSYYSGQKRISTQYNPQNNMNISGATVEIQSKISQYGFIKAELAQSNAPDFRSSHYPNKTRIGSFKDQNVAVAVNLNTYFRSLGLRLEAIYRKSGSNFQSFSTWQINTLQEQWQFKADQQLLGNKLKLSGSIKKQDYSNPFITQRFKSNTIFKTLTASLRIPRLPFISLGYIPVTQYAIAGQDIIETRFQTLTAQVFHQFKLGTIRTTSQFLYSRNLNKEQHAFLYNNTSTTLFTQTFLFKLFISSFSIGDTRNNAYQFTLLENKLNFPLLQNRVQLGGGVKLGCYNNTKYKIGGNTSLNLQLNRGYQFQLNWDRSFIPTETMGLFKNDMANILFVKTIDFSSKQISQRKIL